jgi:hypothetical protein
MSDQALCAPGEAVDDLVHAVATASEREAIQQPHARFPGRVHEVSLLWLLLLAALSGGPQRNRWRSW